MRKFKVVFSSFLALCLCMASSLSAFALASPSVTVNPYFCSFPQLPDGYFDGDILATDSGYSLSLDFSNLGSTISGSTDTESDSFEHYSFTVPAISGIESSSGTSVVTNGWWNWVDGVFWNAMDDIVFVPDDDYQSGNWGTSSDGDPSGGFGYTELSSDRSSLNINGFTITGQTTNTQDYTSSHNLSSDYFGIVTGNITSNSDNLDHNRFYCFSVIYGRGGGSYFNYVYYVIDSRNSFYLDITSSDSYALLNYHRTSTYAYPVFSLLLNSDGSVNTVRSGFLSQGIGFGSTGLNGIWLSDSAKIRSVPSGVDIVFRDAVFGKESLLFSYLYQLESDLNTIHSDLTSLTSSMQSAISNQTNTLINTNSPGNFDQTSMGNTDSMLSLQDSLSAPSTDTIFSSGNTFTDGMGFWRDRMNELLFPSNSPITALTIFSLTLGLAVLIIGRRVNGGGTA